MAACPVLDPESGVIRGVLETLSCNSRLYAQSGYEALAAPGSPFQTWLTALLVIYVAVVGYRLLFGLGARAGDLPLTALKIGAILALLTNWSLFQTLVFDLVWGAPVEIASLVSRAGGADSAFAGDPVGGLQIAYDNLSLVSSDYGRLAGPATNVFASANLAAAQALRQASQALFASTVGLFGVSMAAAAVLTAVGPVFIALFLFNVTRGLFFGWLRAMMATLLAPLFGWIATSLMLMILEPNLVALAAQHQGGRMDTDIAQSAASMVMVFAFLQLTLVAASILIAVGFAGRPRQAVSEREPAPRPEPAAATAQTEFLSRAETLAATLRRSSTETQTGSRAFAPGWRAASAPDGSYALADGAPLTPLRRPEIRSRTDFRSGDQT